MQNGSVIRRNRKKHSDIWQFRWWEKTTDGKKIYRRRQIGTVDQIPDSNEDMLARITRKKHQLPFSRVPTSSN